MKIRILLLCERKITKKNATNQVFSQLVGDEVKKQYQKSYFLAGMKVS
jgi:hypothetical protein